MLRNRRREFAAGFPEHNGLDREFLFLRALDHILKRLDSGRGYGKRGFTGEVGVDDRLGIIHLLAFQPEFLAAGPVADENEGTALLLLQPAEVLVAPVKQCDRHQRDEAEGDHGAALLQGVAAGNEHEGHQERAEHRQHQGDQVQTRVVDAQHVGARLVPVDEIERDDREGERAEQGQDHQGLGPYHPTQPANEVEDHKEGQGIKGQKPDGGVAGGIQWCGRGEWGR